MRTVSGLIAAVVLSGCVELVSVATAPLPVTPAETAVRAPVNFAAVVARIEPLAEQMCRTNDPQANCDFQIFVDTTPGLPANAFQTIDDNGRPVIGFTSALIADARNNDELAFVMGHETAHHIAGHLTRTRDTALAGALLGGLLATLAGGSASDIDIAQNLGGSVGARTYSKEFELEADRLGTVIAFRAGFDPLAGALFFARIPDPGNQFLGSHPPNGARIEAVRQTMAGLR